MISQATWAQSSFQHCSPRVCEVSMRRPGEVADVPDDIVHKVVEFAFDLLLDILSIAVVSRQYGAAARVVARRLLQPPDPAWLFSERMASHFTHWSQLSVRGNLTSEGCDAGIQIPEDDAVVYHCTRCRSPILRTKDIVSTNYHGARGPAFLVNQLYNTVVDRAPYSAAFVTGAYSVCDVACAGCSIQLAKKYMDAREPSNRFKIGKFLLERTMVFAPQCCSTGNGAGGSDRSGSSVERNSPGSLESSKLNSHGSPEVCVRCFRHLECRATQAALLITDGLQPGASRKLREIILAETRLFGDLAAVANGESPSGGCHKASNSAGILRDALPWKLTRLCRALAAMAGKVPACLLLEFTERLAMMLASTAGAVTSTGLHDATGPSRRHASLEAYGSDRRSRTPERRRPGPSKLHLERPSSAPIVAGKGAGALAMLSAAAGVDASLLSAFAFEEGEVSGAHTFRPEVLRWALIIPAAAAACTTMESACAFLTALREEWQPDWPEEKPGVERIIELLSSRLGLNAKGTAQLWKAFGIKVRTGFCIWNPFSFCNRF
eukprot:gb/GFBE01006051.1/.p1 GENE.gb/GFBE01006051.1/~~gb/GFBE01006051.1/.p1  ORF type:complete len:551 (+),score=70.55 gb/GFBE01006051.1/:1-1653(+)